MNFVIFSFHYYRDYIFSNWNVSDQPLSSIVPSNTTITEDALTSMEKEREAFSFHGTEVKNGEVTLEG